MPKGSFIMTNLNIDNYEPPIEHRVDDLIALSTIVNKFIEVKRATLRDSRPETDGEHTLHLQFIAVAYASRYHPELDAGKIALYALIHDFVEVYAGDVNSLSATDEELVIKVLTERAALARLSSELGEIWPRFVDVVHTYEELKDSEACFVKSFDKCDPSFTHINNRGEALLGMDITTREELEVMTKRVVKRMDAYNGAFPGVMAIRHELLSRVANVTYPPV